MKTKVGVTVMPREVILDTQGRAIEQSLHQNGIPVLNCRVGKYIELQFDEEKSVALKRADEIANLVLCNKLLENYKLDVIE